MRRENDVDTNKNNKDMLEYIQYKTRLSCNSIKKWLFYVSPFQTKSQIESVGSLLCFIKRMGDVDTSKMS